MKSLIPTEHMEGMVLTKYLDLLVSLGKVVVFTHTPQETFTKSWGIKMRNKQAGVRKGIPDYLIVTPKKILFIELKRVKGGHVKPDQKIWIEALNTAGATASVCKGFDEAKKFLDENI